MSIVGKWIVKKTMFPTEDGMKHLTKEEIIAAGVSDPEDLQIFCMSVEINEDGTLDTFAEIEEGQCMKVDASTWCEKDGEYFYNMDGEEVALKLDEDGYLMFSMGMILLERV